MTRRNRELAAHLARLAVSGTAIALAARAEPLAAIPAGLMLYLGAFAFQHDLVHAALKLERKIREPLLAAVGALMLLSGHTTRIMHLLHHRKLFAADDVESAVAHGSVWRALLQTPALAIRYRSHAWSVASPRDRRWIRIESALNLLGLVGLFASGSVVLRLYLAIAIAMQLLAPIWAGRVPHTAPKWLLAIARLLARTRSPTVLSLAFHELHHAHPAVPTGRLLDLAL